MTSLTTRNHTAVEEVMADYVDGANGNVELLKSVFHPNALISGQPIAQLYDIVTKRGETHATHRTEFVDVHGPVASVRIIVEGWHGITFVEFFHLILTRQGWKITSKSGADINQPNR